MNELMRPDVMLLDMELPGLMGLEVAQRLQAEGAAVRILVLSAYDDEQYIFGLLSSGAVGYMTKDEALTNLIDAVRGVAKGEEGWLSRRATARVMRDCASPRIVRAVSLGSYRAGSAMGMLPVPNRWAQPSGSQGAVESRSRTSYASPHRASSIAALARA